MTTFAADLALYGPGATGTPVPSRAEAETYCRKLATSHYENFPLVSWLLPPDLHQPFFNVYAYCRWADDLGDEVGDRERSLALLDWWRTELDRCYAGTATHPVFIALQPTIATYTLPIDPFRDLISAFEQDQRVVDYATFDQLRDYCRRSADPVGRLVLSLCRQVTPQNFEWSDSICTGLQLANFWQDVARDFAIGRIYLPQEDRDRFGVTRDVLAAGKSTPEFRALLEFEVTRAREWLTAGLPLIPQLPGRLQVDIDLFAHGGLCILDRIARIDYRVLETRPRVTKLDAARLLCGALLRRGCRAIFRY